MYALQIKDKEKNTVFCSIQNDKESLMGSYQLVGKIVLSWPHMNLKGISKFIREKYPDYSIKEAEFKFEDIEHIVFETIEQKRDKFIKEVKENLPFITEENLSRMWAKYKYRKLDRKEPSEEEIRKEAIIMINYINRNNKSKQS